MFNPNKKRMQAQMSNAIVPNAGQTAVLLAYVSASAGNPIAGYGASAYYRRSVFTGVFGAGAHMNLQQPFPGGTLGQGDVPLVTRSALSNLDQVLWNGSLYTVDTNSQPSMMDGHYMSILRKRASGT